MNDLQTNLFKLCIALAVSCGVTMSAIAADVTSGSATPVAQQKSDGTITGQVLDQNGEPIIGATVTIEGTSKATATGIDGDFVLKAPTGSVVVVKYLGYDDAKAVYNGEPLTIVLKESKFQLEEVVVTALGIKRSEKALSYNVQKVGGEELTTVKSTNFMNSLAGKVAGVNINASSAGMGGATRVVMRGPKSINQSNQALYVVDGVPINNRNNGSSEGMYAEQPGGEGIADLNPEDIESISVLSGPSAAALYGSSAAQGVIMITTKKGAEGKVSVSISNSTQFSSPFKMPEFQNIYPNRPG